MICKETLSQDYDSSFHQAITPCLSFRIAGTPSNLKNNKKYVKMFFL